MNNKEYFEYSFKESIKKGRKRFQKIWKEIYILRSKGLQMINRNLYGNEYRILEEDGGPNLREEYKLEQMISLYKMLGCKKEMKTWGDISIEELARLCST